MAYRRGSRSLEVELAELQTAVENHDDELEGTHSMPGIISLVRNREVREIERKDARDRTDRQIKIFVALGALVPILLKLAEHFHWF